ncbi:MAG: nucleotidyltransferase domain-containing protein [Candidatus Brocadiaceae bacterium]|nr:nucleotidyltransferase domain-containing protein [Candidatus Brocadiaceae bacterium]
MSIKDSLLEKSHEINQIAARHGACDIRLFGSVSGGEDKEESDVDILVKTNEKRSPWFPGGLIADLEELLGKQVEVVTEKGLNKLITEEVLNEALSL